MNIKMIVTDLDNTLLHTDKTISQYSVDVLKQCRGRGIKVVFATARPIRAVRSYIEQVSCDAAVYHNGAVVCVAQDASPDFFPVHSVQSLRDCDAQSASPDFFRVHSESIDAKTASELLLTVARIMPEASISAEINDTMYANFDVPLEWNYTPAVRTDFTDLPDCGVDKIIVGVTCMEEVDAIAKLLPDYLYAQMCGGQLGLVMNKNATKLNGIKHLAARFGIELADVAAFGDDYNDIEMLRGCGVGVAMENALPEVKAVADFVCGVNDDDGMAKWISENVLK